VILLTWNHACAVGIRAMDDQHGILMDTMNDLRLASVRNSSREEVGGLLSRLVELTRLHFLNEEQLMEQYGFPELPEHHFEHQQLLSHLLEHSHRVQLGETVSMRSLLIFLRSWFIDHIGTVDRKYGSWLNERGVY